MQLIRVLDQNVFSTEMDLHENKKMDKDVTTQKKCIWQT